MKLKAWLKVLLMTPVVMVGLSVCWSIASAAGVSDTDILVYGATPAGIATAVSAARKGRSVTVLEPHQHVGGMMAGGLGWDDVDCSYCPIAPASSRGVGHRPEERAGGGPALPPSPATASPAVYGIGIYTELTQCVSAHYSTISVEALNLSVGGTRHEPHVAEVWLSFCHFY